MQGWGSCPTASRLSRAAFSAAMLMRLARSAPLKPGVPRAMTCRAQRQCIGHSHPNPKQPTHLRCRA